MSAGRTDAGFISVVLTAGADGAPAPSSSGGFQFINPAGSPHVGVNQLSGVGTAQASTAGGSAFFGALGLPIVLNVSDGSAVISSATVPAGVVPSTGLASVAPEAPATVPTDAALLSVNLSDPTANGTQILAVSVTDSAGATLGAGQVTVLSGGWWVLGLSPSAETTPPVVTPPVQPPVVVPPPVPPTGPPTAATPEPTTLVLGALGLPLLGMGRLLRRRR